MRRRIITIALVLACSLAAASCGDEGETGTGLLAVETWGEEFIEDGIPADEFADGYEVVFGKFLVVISDVDVTGAFTLVSARVWDLTSNGPFELGSKTVDAGTYDHTAYRIAPSSEATAGNATAADVAFMIDNGYSVYAEGEGKKDDNRWQFAWGFDTSTTYDPCHSEGVLKAGGDVSVQLTIHGDHFFYDSAVSADPLLRFAEIASADRDEDGVITGEELRALHLKPLPNHGVGSLDIDNMWDYISHMTTTLGHIDGEGHCETNP